MINTEAAKKEKKKVSSLVRTTVEMMILLKIRHKFTFDQIRKPRATDNHNLVEKDKNYFLKYENIPFLNKVLGFFA